MTGTARGPRPRREALRRRVRRTGPPRTGPPRCGRTPSGMRPHVMRALLPHERPYFRLSVKSETTATPFLIFTVATVGW